MFSTLLAVLIDLLTGERPARGPKRGIPSRKSGSRASLSVESLEDRRMLNASFPRLGELFHVVRRRIS